MTKQHSQNHPGRPRWIRYIDDELDWYREHQITPRQIILGIDRYQELMAWLAGEEGLDHMEARTEWKDCELVVIKTLEVAEVGGDVNDLWEHGEAFGMTPEAAESIPHPEIDEWAL